MTIAIVTDSTADIPEELAGQHHIQVVPNLMVVNGQSVEDGKGMSREAFYRLLPGMAAPPTTGTASVGVYEALYERLLQGGAAQVVSIHASSMLSGIINAAHTAAEAFGGRVQVFDSQMVTMGLGFQALAAAEAAAQGASLEAILARLQDMRPRARVVAMLDTLEYVRRSGRVSWARARLGELLRIKPFVEVREGAVYSLGEARTRSKGIERLRQLLVEQGPLERLAVLHTDAEADARQFLASLPQLVPSPPVVVYVTTIIGTHVGPNGLGFAVILKT